MRVSRRALALLTTAIVAAQAVIVAVAVDRAGPDQVADPRVLAWSWLVVPLLGLAAYLDLRPALVALAACAALHLWVLPAAPALPALLVSAGAVLLGRLVAHAARRELPGR
jgi:hypothetical protein